MTVPAATATVAHMRRRDALYALALLGAHVAFMPLIILLLPRRVETLAGDGAAALLSAILLAGAVTASVAHILAGYWSDRWMARHGARRLPIACGCVLLALSYVALALAGGPGALLAAIVAFQLALNLTFAPLGALLTDYFRDREKGSVAGLMNAALPLSTAAVAPIAWLAPADGATGFLLTGALVVLLIAPLLINWPFQAVGGQCNPAERRLPIRIPTVRRDFALAWLARFLIQLGAAFVIGYLYIHVAADLVRSDRLGGRTASEIVSLLSLIATLVAIVAALAGGRLSDRLGRRRVPLAVAAGLAATGLMLLAGRPGVIGFIAAYAMFHAGLTGFLAIDTALVAELVSASPRRGMLLGLMNLTNTVPSIAAPTMVLLTLGAMPPGDALGLALMACALAAAVASGAALLIRRVL